jgi:hypothetical protein
VAEAQATKPGRLVTHKAAIFERLTTGLDASQLLRRYRASSQLLHVQQNRHEPAVKDSIFLVSTPADRLKSFKNRYNTLLLSATFTSTKVCFAGLTTGITKKVFCRTFQLNLQRVCVYGWNRRPYAAYMHIWKW